MRKQCVLLKILKYFYVNDGKVQTGNFVSSANCSWGACAWVLWGNKAQRAGWEEAASPLLTWAHSVYVRMFRSRLHSTFWWASKALATSLSLGQGQGPYRGLLLLSAKDFPAAKVTFLEAFGRVKCHLSIFLAVYSSPVIWPGSLSKKTSWSQTLK